MPRLRSIVEVVAGSVLAIALGLVAARFRLFDSWPAVVVLGLVVAALIGFGLRALAQPWDDAGD
ncbi:MAG: hypothetical protein IPF82_11275 [Blastocatellia bacterium]|jgi:hypothetical protein|nr:hypothetical protein [Blastocatellia bacterium]